MEKVIARMSNAIDTIDKSFFIIPPAKVILFLA